MDQLKGASRQACTEFDPQAYVETMLFSDSHICARLHPFPNTHVEPGINTIHTCIDIIKYLGVELMRAMRRKGQIMGTGEMKNY